MRAVLVSGLLDGDVTAADQLVESAGMLNLQRSGEFVVVSAECPAPGAEALPDVEPVLRRHNVTSAWRLDHEHQDGLVELRLGFDAPLLVDALTELARGRVGISAAFRGLANAADARRQARLAALRRHARVARGAPFRPAAARRAARRRARPGRCPGLRRPRPGPRPSPPTIATCSCRQHAPG